MKRKLFGKTIKHAFLAIPASALMLGSSQAATSVGINFQGNYGGSYSGAVVTATALGLPASAWFTAPDQTSGALNVSPATGGALAVNWSCANTWASGLDPEIVFDGTTYTTPNPLPGDGEVFWGYLDDSAPGNTVSVSGLNAVFPNGYVIETFAADVGSTTTFAGSTVSDGVTISTNLYSNYLHPVNFYGPPFNSVGTAALSAQSTVFTSDTINVSGGTRGSTGRAGLCGFIITDLPVVTQAPANTTNDVGSTLTLKASIIGVPPLSYQWRLNGTNISGATGAAYTNANIALTDGGNYDVVVTNLYGSATSPTAVVTINQAATIQTQLPTAVTNLTSMNAAFSVVVGGVQPLSYQWFKNGTFSGATNATLNLTNLQTSDTATYQLIVSNSYGAATSSIVSLTVLPALPPYDGFDYTAGDLNGQAGGTGGWSGAWTMESGYNGDHAVVAPAAPWRGGISELTSTGGKLQLAAIGTSDFDDIRSLVTTIGGNGCGTVYLSYVAQVTNTTWGGIELVKDGTTSLFTGCCFNGRNWGWGTRGAPDLASTVSPLTYSLLVYRFDYTPTNTLIRLYVNPSSFSAEPTNASISGPEPRQIAFNQIRIVSHGFYGTVNGPDGYLDEVRVGGTWAAVTPHVIRTDAPFAIQMVKGGVINDSKPVGVAHAGLNYGTGWLASSTGTNIFSGNPGLTRTGVQQFVQSNNTQVIIPPNPDFNSTNGTIAFWIQYPFPGSDVLPGTGSESAMLFDRRTTSGTIIGLNASGGIQFQATGGAHFTGSAYLTDGNWHHVAITYGQSTNDTVSLYVDGVLDVSQVNPGNWSWPTNQEIELGRSHDSYWFVYDGQMDDVRIYNRILTASEITTISTSTTSDQLVDANALKLRYNFDADAALTGTSLVWPYGTLISSPALDSTAVWTPMTNAVSPLPILTSAPALFYRLTGTP